MFHTIFIEPLLNALALFVGIVPGNDLGLAIILLTIAVKLVLYPFSIFAMRSQAAMQEIQPELNALKKKFSDSKEKQIEAMMALYRERHISPVGTMLGTFLLLALQLPVLIGMFQIFGRDVAGQISGNLYSFIPPVTHISTTFLGLLDIAKPAFILALLAGAAQFYQARVTLQKMNTASAPVGDFAAMFQKQSQYIFPIITVVIGLKLPAALPLYWIVFTLLAILDEVWLKSIFLKAKQTSPAASPNAVAG